MKKKKKKVGTDGWKVENRLRGLTDVNPDVKEKEDEVMQLSA